MYVIIMYYTWFDLSSTWAHAVITHTFFNSSETMRRQKAGVSFHDPKTVGNVTSSENFPNNDVTDHDPKAR